MLNCTSSSSFQIEAITESVEMYGERSTNCLNENGSGAAVEMGRRVFVQDPPWVNSLFLKGLYYKMFGNKQEVKNGGREVEKRKYRLLRKRQVKAETEAWDKMMEEYKELEKEMRERKLAPNLPHVKKLFLGWFEPLRDAIEKDQKSLRSAKQKAAFATNIELLPADKIAVIVMHKMIGLVMVGNEDGCIRVVQAAVQVGVAIEHEVTRSRSLHFVL